AQPARLGPAPLKFPEVAQWRRWRSAVGPAGMVGKLSRQSVHRNAELQVPDFKTGWPILSKRNVVGCNEEACEPAKQDQRRNAVHDPAFLLARGRRHRRMIYKPRWPGNG